MNQAALFLVLFLLLFLSIRLLSRQLGIFLSKFSDSRDFVGKVIGILFLPGTMIHEFSHASVAQMLGVHVGEINLTLKVEEKSIKMGSVQIGQTDPFRRFLIGIAPAIVGMVLVLILFKLYQLFGQFWPWWAIGLLYFSVFQIGNGMFSSRRDMEGAVELIVALAILWGILYLFGVKFDALSFVYNLAEGAQGLFRLLNGALVKILIIDGSLILLFGVINTLLRIRR